MTNSLKMLARLEETLDARKSADPDKSYVASLYNKGPKKVAQKVGEEAIEVAMAVAMDDDKSIITESADLVFHLMVLLKSCGFTLEDVIQELARREGLSGLEEKASRGN